ncbi:MAG TPA: hypothetical protein VFW56_04345 [Bradyrhizobium sp.]|nr:hypothetical protein [Bradyrhizobium sp.]
MKWIAAIELIRDFADLGAGQAAYNEDHEFYGCRMPICQLGDVVSAMSHGDETKLDPEVLSLVNAACAKTRAKPMSARFSFSSVVLRTNTSPLAYCRNRSTSVMSVS